MITERYAILTAVQDIFIERAAIHFPLYHSHKKDPLIFHDFKLIRYSKVVKFNQFLPIQSTLFMDHGNRINKHFFSPL